MDLSETTSESRRVLRLVRLRKSAIERKTGVPFGRRLGCGTSGCAYRATRGRTAKLTSSPAEARMWSRIAVDQDEGKHLADAAFPPIRGVWAFEWRDDVYSMVWRDDVEPAFVYTDFGTVAGSPRSRQLGFEFEASLPYPEQLALESREFAIAAQDVLGAMRRYQIFDVHLGNLGWVGNRMVIFDGESMHEAPPIPVFALNPSSGSF